MKRWIYPRGVIILAIILAIAFPLKFGTSYSQYTLDLILIYGLLAVGLMIAVGYAGQVSIGQSAFMGLGAYLATILTINDHWSFWLALPVAAIGAGLFGYVIGIPASRLETVYFSVLTLGLAAALPEALIQLTSVTNGYAGLTPTYPTFFGIPLRTNASFYYVALAILVILLWVAHNWISGNVGRSLVAARESPLAAQALGISVAQVKALALGISAFYAAAAGVLLAFLNQYVTPDNFSVTESFTFLAMVIVGGMNSVWGALIGAALFTVLQPLTANLQALQQVIIGAVMIVVMKFLPDGLWSLGRRTARLTRLWGEGRLHAER